MWISSYVNVQMLSTYCGGITGVVGASLQGHYVLWAGTGLIQLYISRMWGTEVTLSNYIIREIMHLMLFKPKCIIQGIF